MNFVTLPIVLFTVLLLVGGLSLIADAAVRVIRGK
jgi:hypothetical protein